MPWYGSGVATFVHRRSAQSPFPDGFVQAKKRLGRPEAELWCLSPPLEADPDASHTWRALLEHLIAHAGEFGIQRLYACLPAQDEAAGLVAECGFAPYVRETLFRLGRPRTPDAAPPQGATIRPQRESDGLALQRLADRFTPPVVLKAEGAHFTNGGVNHTLIFQRWWQPGRSEGFIFEREGIVEAALLIESGSRGIWLHYLGDPMQQEMANALLMGSLARLRADDRPIYCSVRTYQSALGAPLRDLGFEDIGELTRLVKHTTVRVQEPAVNKTRLLIETTFPGVISSKLKNQ